MTEKVIRLPNRRVRTPTILQMEAAECGAAALAIVLAHYGLILPLERLREECGVSRDGSKATNILRAARRFGMNAKAFKQEIGALGKVRLPAIIFWNFNHFVVLEGIGRHGKVFFINDPASGRRKIPAEEFYDSFTGITLTFEKSEEFRKGGARTSILWFLVERMRGSLGGFLFAALCALFLVVPGTITPAFTSIFVDDVLIGSEDEWIRPLLLGMTAAILLQVLLTLLKQNGLLRFRTKLALSGSGRFMAHILRLPMHYYAQRFSGEIASRLEINDEIAGVVGGELADIALNFVLVFFFGVLLFFYNPTLAWIAVAAAGLNILIVKLVSRVRSDRSRVGTQEYGKLMGTSVGGLSQIETIKSSSGEDDFFARWAGYQARFLAEKQSLLRFSQAGELAPSLLQSLSSAGVLSVGAFLIMDGQLTIGTLIAFQALAGQFSGPVESLVQFSSNLQVLEANMTRVNDVMRAEEDPIYTTAKTTAPASENGKLAGRVELRGITFGYSPLDAPLIENFNLTIEPGQRVALVGGSGSGKSTVAKLACALYQPWEGEVLADGIPIGTIPRDMIANSLSMVDQEITFFSGTISENLSLWDPSISERDLLVACRDAEIADAITARPGGFQSLIEEGGRNFSGGQRQRLEIARALASNPTILILDEATSALDATTEAMIDRNLRRRGCTCLIVAHRLSTIRDADEIVVLEKGKVVERGVFEELMAIDGPFRRLMEQ